MSITDSDPSRPGVKTLAIRLDPELHAQLSLVAQLRGKTITDEIRTAIETHINAVKTSPEIVGKADSVLQEIEREAEARRAAIATLFGTGDNAATPSSSRARRKEQTD